MRDGKLTRIHGFIRILYIATKQGTIFFYALREFGDDRWSVLMIVQFFEGREQKQVLGKDQVQSGISGFHCRGSRVGGPTEVKGKAPLGKGIHVRGLS